MSRTLGFVVVEFNQASGQPVLADVTVHRDEDDAQAAAKVEREFTAKIGRRERYAVAEVLTEDDPE